MRTAAFLICLFLTIVSARADCLLDEVVGYTLAASKTITAYIDEDGTRHDGYEGCQFGRTLVFEDETGLKCQIYQYHYAYRPTAYIFVLGNSIKACIDGDMVDLGPLN